jgi:hypothetical protein
MKRWFWIILLLITSGVAAAQDAAGFTVSYGTPVEGELSNARTDQVWTLTTETADRIAVVVERLSGDLLPQLAVRGIDGSVLTTAGQDPSGAVARVERLDLPAAGTYQIIIQRQDSATGVTEGRYRLRVTLLSAPLESSANQSIVGTLETGSSARGEITAAHWYQRYTYTVPSADFIRIEVLRLSGGLQPQIEVLDAAGEQVGYGWGEPDSFSARIDRLELPAAGEYAISILRSGGFDGTTTGEYSISITLLGAGEDSPLFAERSAQPVRYGTPVRGEIGALWYEDWTLTATSADVITIGVTSEVAPGGSIATLLTDVLLLDAGGNEIAGAGPNADGTSSGITRYVLPAAGEYTIRIARSSRKTGGTTGQYTLTVNVNGFGADNPALAQITGSMRVGAAVTGQIGDPLWENRWQFDGRAGQVVDIDVERISGTLYPIIDLLDASGQSIGGSWYDASRTRAFAGNITLPADGTYVVRIRREGEQGGWTSGEYRLSVSQTTQ